jgi:hypothetical protein
MTGIILVISATAFETEARLIKQGSISVGGSSNLGISNYDNDQNFYNINGSIGYFIFNNFELGSFLWLYYDDYLHSYEDDTYYSDTKQYGIGPFIAYHIPVNDPSNFYIRCGFGYEIHEIGHSEEDNININASGGWEYFFTPSVAGIVGLHYHHTNWENGDSNSYRTDVGLKIFF